ncbi:DUF2000 family protein [Allorhizobium sp. BGMRC 0089]|uniref:DUF2000 family protein n=1 Tax=Allorhizobium sonneratiae TaxID=2934936 RepID=UPI002033AD48|nr:DUF2000 family protein [Allorhizobium sonneratiae]MCM2290952.1 DUF2000 family protein [Allorhizobium sonneratiae]
MFETKIALVVRDDLAVWQKLNVTAFLTSGVVSQAPDIIGEAYRDGAGHVYNAMTIQPIIVLVAGQAQLKTILNRALERQIVTSAYIEEMFATGHDAANRDVFSRFTPDTANLVGLGLRAERKIVDKITKGARMHP